MTSGREPTLFQIVTELIHIIFGKEVIHITKKSLVVLVGTLFATSLLFSQTAFAAEHSNNTRPGWGHGDKNHVHTGPPGKSVHPGESVHPGHDGDNDGDDHDDINKKFHNFLSAWFQFVHNHPWKWQWQNNQS